MEQLYVPAGEPMASVMRMETAADPAVVGVPVNCAVAPLAAPKGYQYFCLLL